MDNKEATAKRDAYVNSWAQCLGLKGQFPFIMEIPLWTREELRREGVKFPDTLLPPSKPASTGIVAPVYKCPPRQNMRDLTYEEQQRLEKNVKKGGFGFRNNRLDREDFFGMFGACHGLTTSQVMLLADAKDGNYAENLQGIMKRGFKGVGCGHDGRLFSALSKDEKNAVANLIKDSDPSDADFKPRTIFCYGIQNRWYDVMRRFGART